MPAKQHIISQIDGTGRDGKRYEIRVGRLVVTGKRGVGLGFLQRGRFDLKEEVQTGCTPWIPVKPISLK